MYWTIKNSVKTDFDKYMFTYYSFCNRFSLEEFADYATSLINYYVLNQHITRSQKKEVALYLVFLYNKGVGNAITEEHIHKIADLIVLDESLNFTIINKTK